MTKGSRPAIIEALFLHRVLAEPSHPSCRQAPRLSGEPSLGLLRGDSPGDSERLRRQRRGARGAAGRRANGPALVAVYLVRRALPGPRALSCSEAGRRAGLPAGVRPRPASQQGCHGLPLEELLELGMGGNRAASVWTPGMSSNFRRQL